MYNFNFCEDVDVVSDNHICMYVCVHMYIWKQSHYVTVADLEVIM